MNAISKKKKKPGPIKDKPKKKPASPAREGEEALPKQSFLKRLIFGEEKPDLSEIEVGSTRLRPTPVSEHIPAWRARLVDEAEKPAGHPGQEPPQAEPDPAPAPQPEARPKEPQDGPEPRFDYDFTGGDGDLGMVEKPVSSVLGEDMPEWG